MYIFCCYRHAWLKYLKMPNSHLAKAFAIVGYDGVKLLEAVDANMEAEKAADHETLFLNPSVLFMYHHETEKENEILPLLEWVIETRFSRPNAYQVVKEPKQPDFHTVRLTDRQCNTTYLSVLIFYEAFKCEAKHGQVFIPKFLVVISEKQMSDLFKICLKNLYEKITFEDGGVECLNMAICNMVNHPLPPIGQSNLLHLGFGDQMIVHSPVAKSVPKTGLTVHRLVRVLGPENTARAFFCLISQLQVTMYSSDVSFLTDSCEALLALLYPFEYFFIYAPVQTKRCLDRYKTLENPTPFFIGICEEPNDVLSEVSDKVVLVNLDRKTINFPELSKYFKHSRPGSIKL